jgi:hypothetical protein
MPNNSLVDQVKAEVAEWKQHRVYLSVTTSVDDPEFRVSVEVDGDVNIHMGPTLLSMSPTKWRELAATVEAALADAEVTA